MAEVAPAGGGGGFNRTFLLIVGGLAALLVIGLLAVGALLFLNPKSSALVQSTTTPTRIAIQPTASLTKVTTPTLVVVAATNTPVVLPPTATSTNSPAPASTQAAASGTPGTETKGGQAEASPTATPGGQMPESGLGENLLLLAGGLVLVGILFAARRARVSS